MAKKLVVILLIVCGVIFVLSVITSQLCAVAISALTGSPTSVTSLSVNVFNQSVTIKGLRMNNPSGFPGGVLLDLPLAHVDIDIFSLFKGKIHIQRVDINLKEIGLVKNAKGELNVDALNVAKAQKTQAKSENKQLAFSIDVLNIAMGRIISKDYSLGKEPFVQVYEINLKKTYEHINSPSSLVALIISEPLKHAGIKGAAIYGVALASGVGIIPVALAATLTGKDSIEGLTRVSFEKTFEATQRILSAAGKIIKSDSASGVIESEYFGAGVTVQLKKEKSNSTKVVVSARKHILPQPEIAAGVLYQITQNAK